MVEREFSKAFSSLDGVFSFLEEFFSSANVDPGSAYAITLAVEEFFTNMVKYNPEGDSDITVRVAREGDMTSRRPGWWIPLFRWKNGGWEVWAFFSRRN
jgi:two-component sensor histidine kinase